MKIRVVGDVHGNIDSYLKVIEGTERSIQVGDMGIGFIVFPNDIPIEHRFIRGNHDNPKRCRTIKNWIPDGTFEDGIFYLGGAYSIDQAWRIEDLSWWRDEELSIPLLDIMIDKYEQYKPSIVITHDCPQVIADYMFSHHKQDSSRTRQALDKMFDIHKPDMWLFGHHHKNYEKIIVGTRFIALDELSYKNIEIS
jgi:hypothetical protein